MKKPCQYRYDKKVLLIMAGDGKVGFGVYFLKENHEDTENTEKHGEEGIRILDLRFEGEGASAAYLLELSLLKGTGCKLASGG